MPERLTRILRRGAAALLFACLIGCRKPASVEPGGRSAAVPVLAGEVGRKDVPFIVKGIGAVHPLSSVTVKPQVGGQLASVHFKEGQDLRKGDPLFTIDKRPFEVALAQTQASLELAQALAANATDQAERYKTLKKNGAVAAEQFEQIQTTLRTTAAGVKSAEAVERTARLQLEYCEIPSPLDGRAGKYLVDPGNVVQANQTELVVINQIDPIEVTFAVAERYLGEIRRHIAEGPLKVVAVPDGKELKPVEGHLVFVDNAVKATTGTIELKALFANNPKVLWPGQFVDVELWLTTDRAAVVVPVAAVQTGQEGPFVYVIGSDLTVEARTIELARVAEDVAVVRDGLTGGEKIVLDGQSRLRPGARVEIKSRLAVNAGMPVSDRRPDDAALSRAP